MWGRDRDTGVPTIARRESRGAGVGGTMMQLSNQRLAVSRTSLW